MPLSLSANRVRRASLPGQSGARLDSLQQSAILSTAVEGTRHSEPSDGPIARNNVSHSPLPSLNGNPEPLRFEPSKERIAKTDPVWRHYVEVADHDDKASVQAWNSDFDTLPVFAGLFSTVVTTFIIEVYKDLKPEPNDVVVLAIQEGFHFLNSSTPFVPPSPFRPSARAVRVNGCFFMSLAFSLMSAAGAMVSKVWCSEYTRRSTLGSPHEQALRRHWHYNGLHKFRYQDMLDILPVLLYSSIMMFMVGLCDYVYGLHRRTAIYLITFFSCSFVFAATLTFLSLVLPVDYPYRIPLADVIIKISSYVLRRFLDKMSRVHQSFYYWKKAHLHGIGTWPRFTWKSLGHGLMSVPRRVWMICGLVWQHVCLVFHSLARAYSTMLEMFSESWNLLKRSCTPQDAFGGAITAKPVDDGYSSMEVEALAWLVRSSPEEAVVNDLLKDIPTIVSTFKRRRKFFIRNGAVDRLCTLFESSFDRDWEGPYPGVLVSLNRRKRVDMMEYGFSIYTLCTPQTFPVRLSSEITCLQNEEKLSHKILGMALQSCQDTTFYVNNGDLNDLISGAISQIPPVSEEELEMVLGLALRAVQFAPFGQKLVSSRACDALCGLMRTRSLTSRTAALFCQAVYYLLFNQEMEAPLHDYNPALCSYYLSYQCVAHLDKMPAKDAESYSIIFMRIIQCLCNNEAQLELHDKAQRMYVSFVCRTMLQPGATFCALKEGVVTLSALSQKSNWEQQDIKEIICSCYKAATHAECNTGVIEESLIVSCSIAPALVLEMIYDSNIAQAMIFYLSKELLSGPVFPGHCNLSMHYHVSKAIQNDIQDTFMSSIGPETSQPDGNILLPDLFRFSKFSPIPPSSLQGVTSLINGGLTSIDCIKFINHLAFLEENNQGYPHMPSIIHALCLHPSTIPTVLSDRSIMKNIVSSAGNVSHSFKTRKSAVSLGLLIWHRAADSSPWSVDERKDWINECVLNSGFITIGEHTLRMWTPNDGGKDIIWVIHNWLTRLDELIHDYSGRLSCSNILGTISTILGSIPDNERQIIWRDKMGPAKYTVHCRDLQEKVKQLISIV